MFLFGEQIFCLSFACTYIRTLKQLLIRHFEILHFCPNEYSNNLADKRRPMFVSFFIYNLIAKYIGDFQSDQMLI